jgi:ATP-dependent Clp protease ATP-binding subunit ClpC
MAEGPKRPETTKPASSSRADAPPGLDLAFDWLQRNIDELARVDRRIRDLGARRGATHDPGKAAGASTSASSAVAAAATSSAAAAGTAGSPASGTPLLDSIGRDLTALAAAGSLAPTIGREAETEWIIEVLVRTTKRNPVLLGPAGVGKTAIVEGLAERIVAGRVPKPLLGARIIEVPLSSITAGTQYRGQLEERVAQLVKEASKPGIIMFFDEIHLLAGAGKTEGGMGADQILKPALSRGDVAIIGATTPEAYRKTIALDAALARRFTTVVVSELDRAASRPILVSVRDALAASRGVTVSDEALDVLLDFADKSIANRRFPDKAIDLLEGAIAHSIVVGATSVDREAAVAATVSWSARASSTPTLEWYGRDLVALARDGKLGPIVGRDGELDAIVEVLLRRTKRNPILLGPAGSGKTAIIEGLAIRIASGAVPSQIAEVRIFEIPLLSLAAAIGDEPGLLGDFLVEVRHPSVVVFFDEVHLLAAPAVHDLAESLKPALARGEIACIGATTADEYQAFIEPETALARRFTEIAVEPMGEAAVRTVLVAVRDKLASLRRIKVSDEALTELVALADQFLPNRFFPDKGVDLIEQSVAYALTHGRSEVDVTTAREAVAAMTGMPLDPSAPLAALATRLRDRGLLDEDSAKALIARLGVSLRGLDARRERPDAVVLLCDDASALLDPLAAAIALSIFGRETARIDIDLAGLTDDSSISTLLGSAPGLIGSDRPLPLHELRRSPWQVVVLRSVDSCAVSIRNTIASALGKGSFTDAMGRKIPLGAAVVILTAPLVGAPDDGPAEVALALRLGPTLVGTCDVVAGTGAVTLGSERERWVRNELLAPLAARFARSGYAVTFEPEFVIWLERSLPTDGSPPDGFIDRSVTQVIAPALPPQPGPIRIGIVDDRPTLTAGSLTGSATAAATIGSA